MSKKFLIVLDVVFFSALLVFAVVYARHDKPTQTTAATQPSPVSSQLARYLEQESADAELLKKDDTNLSAYLKVMDDTVNTDRFMINNPTSIELSEHPRGVTGSCLLVAVDSRIGLAREYFAITAADQSWVEQEKEFQLQHGGVVDAYQAAVDNNRRVLLDRLAERFAPSLSHADWLNVVENVEGLKPYVGHTVEVNQRRRVLASRWADQIKQIELDLDKEILKSLTH